MNEETQKLRAQIQERYNCFYKKMGIDTETGIWTKAPTGRELRFATMPHIGENYHNAPKKILFVGLDIGKDEQKVEYNLDIITNFQYRRDCFVPKSFTGCPNVHVSGMMIDTLYLLKTKYEDIWNEVFVNLSNIQNRSVINRLQSTFPISILDYVSQTNFHKFVTVGRGLPNKDGVKLGRAGATDRAFFGDSPEERVQNQIDIEQLFLDEVELLNPDVIWFHSNDFSKKCNDYRVLKTLRDQGRQIIVSYHPSYKHACTPKYILGLENI